jgi:hypothetical protein
MAKFDLDDDEENLADSESIKDENDTSFELENVDEEE